jgi:hypothetical protein
MAATLHRPSFPTVNSGRPAYKTTLQARALYTASVLQKQLHREADGDDAAFRLHEDPLEAAVLQAGALQLPPMQDVLAELCPQSPQRIPLPLEPRKGDSESMSSKCLELLDMLELLERRASKMTTSSTMTTSTTVGSSDSDSDDSDFIAEERFVPPPRCVPPPPPVQAPKATIDFESLARPPPYPAPTAEYFESMSQAYVIDESDEIGSVHGAGVFSDDELV